MLYYAHAHHGLFRAPRTLVAGRPARPLGRWPATARAAPVTTSPAELMRDLNDAGVPVSSLWELVNAKVQYRPAIPVLTDWLQNIDQRVHVEDRAVVLEGIVRALTVPAARPSAALPLIERFRRETGSPEFGLRWVIGNALSITADDSVFDDIAALIRDRSYGRARQMLVEGLSRSRDSRAVPLLVELTADDHVAAHAVRALSKLKPVGVRAAIEPLLGHPQALVRREARKALARLP